MSCAPVCRPKYIFEKHISPDQARCCVGMAYMFMPCIVLAYIGMAYVDMAFMVRPI